MSEGSGRRKYDREFKEEAVKLVTEGGRQVAEVARSLGIHENMLRTWKRRHKEDPAGSFPGKGHQKPQDEELRRLQKENANLKEEREILKKALAIFSKHPK
jgi:transposase